MTKVRFLSPFTPLFIKQTFTECLPSARSCAEVTIRSSQPRLVSLWCLLGTGSGGGVLLQGRQCKKKYSETQKSANPDLTAGEKLNH